MSRKIKDSKRMLVNEPMKVCCRCGETRTPMAIEIEEDSRLKPFTDGICRECYLRLKRLKATEFCFRTYVNVHTLKE